MTGPEALEIIDRADPDEAPDSPGPGQVELAVQVLDGDVPETGQMEMDW